MSVEDLSAAQKGELSIAVLLGSEKAQLWIDYWCGNCAKRETHSTRMCSDPRLSENDFGELKCSRYQCEVMEV